MSKLTVEMESDHWMDMIVLLENFVIEQLEKEKGEIDGSYKGKAFGKCHWSFRV